MGGLLSLLLFAGFFYLMMRFGCGAHMVHGGHGGHAGHEGHRPSGNAEAQTKDPVCGMPVTTGQGYSEVYDGQEYRFCSRACLDKFDAIPSRYLPQKGDPR